MISRVKREQARALKGGLVHSVPAELDKLVRKWESERCGALSFKEMPALAQRLHHRQNYICGRPRYHDGPHRWPDDPRLLIVQWPAL